MNKKKHTLKIDSTIDYLALGLASTESEFNLSLSLNSLLSIKLTSQPILKKGKLEDVFFPCFRFDNEELHQIILIKNKHRAATLFQNQTSFDFIILLSGLEASKNASLIQDKLKDLTNTTLISPLETKKLGNFKNLIQQL